MFIVIINPVQNRDVWKIAMLLFVKDVRKPA